MGRMRWVVLASCLLLAGCGGRGGGLGPAPLDYIDFVRVGGVTYYVADHGVGRPIDSGDLGPRFAVVRANPPTSGPPLAYRPREDRKSTRLNSSHANISYAVFCLKKKKN